MIYLSTDNSFFTLGAEVMSTTENKGVPLTGVNIIKAAPGKISFISK